MYISNNKSNTTFEKAYFDKGVRKIVDDTCSLPTNYIRDMFDVYNPKSTVLFSLDAVSNRISAINLNTGFTCPRTAEANGSGLNNLMGELLNTRTYYHRNFWDKSQNYQERLGYSVEHEFKDGKSIQTIRRKNSYYFPYIKRIIHENGDIIIEHQYSNGFKFVFQRKDGKLVLLKITHKDLIPALYDSSEGTKFNNPILTNETVEYYKRLPKIWKKYCLDSLENLLNSLKDN